MPGWIGPSELILLAVVALVFFGPKRLPEAGRSLGKSLREFKHAISLSHEDSPAAAIDPEPPPASEPARLEPRDTIG